MPISRQRWRGASVFGPGQRVPVDREFIAVYKAKLHLNRRPGRLTLGCVAVALFLLRTIGTDGRLDPSTATIAAACALHPDTVSEARKRLHQCGFLQWDRRLRRDTATGWRCEQTSNAYRLRLPARDTDFPGAVRFSVVKRASVAKENPLANAARQLRAMNFPVPAEWGNA